MEHRLENTESSKMIDPLHGQTEDVQHNDQDDGEKNDQAIFSQIAAMITEYELKMTFWTL